MNIPKNAVYATGKRKTSIARLWLAPGTGQITVNNKSLADYLGRKALELLVHQPLDAVSLAGRVDVYAKVLGGGVAGQAGAIRQGISKALIVLDPELRPTLRQAGFLTRDPRVKERKKYGLKRARRAFQFCKR